MAKRSDFAQKLLDDLRLRKERMAASSQSSNRSNSMAIIDAYSYAKQNYRGSKDVRTNEMIGSRTGNARYKSTGSSRLSFGGEASKQIVSYGRGQSSEQFGDLSMALTFAIENAGKLGRTDSSTRSSMLGFLQQMGRRSVSSADRHRPSTSQLPAFSPIQIEEISKGAMKLNQILRACSNGLNFDRYSIEIGKELLKGAIDLENSLKMLVNLQEASGYMVSPQKKKNRIKLLEEGEEDDDESTANIAEEWKLDLPRFSFDKPSRNSIQEFGRTGHKQRLPALTNSTEQYNNFNHDSQLVAAPRSSSHSRSISYGSNARSLSTLSERKNQPSPSDSKSEKARIPNVIAKLMGLDKLPETDNSTSTTQKNFSSRPKDERETSRRATQEETTKIVGHKAKGPENLVPPKKQKVVEVSKNPVSHITSFVRYKEKNMPAHVNFEVVIDDEQSPWENSQASTSVTRSEKAMTRRDEQQNVVVQLKQSSPSRMDNKKQSSSSQRKSQSNLEPQQPLMPRKLVSEEREQGGKQVSQARKQKGSEIMPKSSSKPARDGINLQQKQTHSNQEKMNKRSVKKASNAIQTERRPNGRVQDDDMVRERGSAESNFDKDSNNSNPDQILSPGVQEPESIKEKPRIPPVMDEKAVHVPIIQREKVARVHKSESSRRIDVVARRNGTLSNMARAARHQSSILKDVKSKRVEKLRDIRPEEAEPRIIKSNRIMATKQPMDLAQELLKKETDNAYTLDTSNEDDHKCLREPEAPASNESCQIAIPITQEDQAPFCEDQEPQSGGDVPNEVIGPHNEETKEISFEPQLKQEKTIENIKPSEQRLEEPLTETENHLKQILIKSQLFLNTAEALFKLDIPIDVLNAGGHDHDHQYHNEDRKLKLDCGYELMRRKGRKQELALHPCVKTAISFIMTTTFDGLVKQLTKDFDKLRSYGRNGAVDCEADHEYLPRMLESDVYNKDPHVNCMWDLGWNEGMFAFIEIDEVVRDVEKYLLNGLLDDITGDLILHMSFS
ncbi:hypothetical protein PanWU01x14_297270 [Parasponia andersonii]|uniref:DUF3741 domain-containing protein n=1 Tax=Parasponia andersonii TaxID=3476 RepID=A0A2P5AVD7_PARAD|nr:hypothetical protein PanWU01x14_297270 [Parasponia andersonii]